MDSSLPHPTHIDCTYGYHAAPANAAPQDQSCVSDNQTTELHPPLPSAPLLSQRQLTFIALAFVALLLVAWTLSKRFKRLKKSNPPT